MSRRAFLLLLVILSSIVSQSSLHAQSSNSVVGTVTDAVTGQPLPNINVTLRVEMSGGYRSFQSTTDANGQFRFVGDWYGVGVEVKDPADVYYAEPSKLQRIEPWQTVTIDMQMVKFGHIRGVVTDRGTGTPLSNIVVIGYYKVPDNNSILGTVHRTNASGQFNIAMPPGKPYYVAHFQDESGQHVSAWYEHTTLLDKATHIPIIAGETTVVDMQMEHTAVIQGQLLMDEQFDTIRERISLSIYEDEDSKPEYELLSEGGRKIELDDSGNYRITGILSGKYKLQYTYWSPGSATTGYASSTSRWSRANVVQAIGGATTSLDIDLTATGEIRGSIVQERRRPVEDDFIVQAFNEDGEIAALATTKANGSYAFKYLMPGSYTIVFTGQVEIPCSKFCYDPEQRYEPQTYAQPLTIAPGQIITDIDANVMTVGSSPYTFTFLPAVMR